MKSNNSKKTEVKMWSSRLWLRFKQSQLRWSHLHLICMPAVHIILISKKTIAKHLEAKMTTAWHLEGTMITAWQIQVSMTAAWHLEATMTTAWHLEVTMTTACKRFSKLVPSVLNLWTPEWGNDICGKTNSWFLSEVGSVVQQEK